MKILIVGASGLVGSHCMNLLANYGFDVVGTHLNYATEKTIHFDPINDETYLPSFQPDIIVHCGALTNVDYCEINEAESKALTISSTQKIARYCKTNNTKLIYISTDYVFDGICGPYTESAKTNPINVYGKHKLEAEEIVTGLGNYIIARVTNVYGEEERKKNFISRLISSLERNESKQMLVPVDQFATPIYAGDIARMLYLLIRDNKKGIYHLSSTDYYTRHSLAERVKTYFPSNQNLTLKPVRTSQLMQMAQRPLYGGLLNMKFLNEYDNFIFSNVDDFVKKTINHGI